MSIIAEKDDCGAIRNVVTAHAVFPRAADQCELCPLQARGRALFSSFLSMQKTKKSVAKRFKLTSTGKLVRRTPGFRHLLAAKSTKQKRRASRDKLVAEGHAKPLKRCLPFGL